MARIHLLLAVVAVFLGSAVGFQVAPRGSLVAQRSQLQQHAVASFFAARTAAPRHRRQAPWVSMQMGPLGEKDRGTMPTYEEEREKEFFKTSLDKATTEEKFKDPVALVALGWIVAMFGIATILILNGGA